MNEYTRDRLLYECDIMRKKTKYEIEAAERQLTSVKKRLQGLIHDLYLYAALILLPLLFIGLLSLLPGRFSIMQMILEYALSFLACVSFIALPFNIYHFIKTCMLIQINKESDHEIMLPPLEGSLKGHSISQELSFRSEHNKLVSVLTRYYLNLEKLDNLEKQINAKECTMTMDMLKQELAKLPFYEDIRPADTFSGSMAKKAKKISWIIFGTLLGILLIIVIL